MAMDGQRNGHGRNVTCHPTRYNSPIKMMRTQSDTRQTLSSPTVATTARIHPSTSGRSRRPIGTSRSARNASHPGNAQRTGVWRRLVAGVRPEQPSGLGALGSRNSGKGGTARTARGYWVDAPTGSYPTTGGGPLRPSQTPKTGGWDGKEMLAQAPLRLHRTKVSDRDRPVRARPRTPPPQPNGLQPSPVRMVRKAW